LRLGILRETAPGETRVALLPDSVKAIVAQGIEVQVEQGAGLTAGLADDAYAAAGAILTTNRDALLASADVLPVVNALVARDQRLLKSGAHSGTYWHQPRSIRTTIPVPEKCDSVATAYRYAIPMAPG
jgi:NAD/NADP transhydrogenase alpha subunit